MIDPDYIAVQKRTNWVHSDLSPIVEKERGTVHMRKFLTALAQLAPNLKSLLDVGCRYGYALNDALAAFPEARLVGVDIVPEFVEDTRDVGVEAVQASIEELPFADGEFDWVFSSHTLEHAKDVQKAAFELTRVAKHGLYLAVPLEKEEWGKNWEAHNTFYPNPMQWLELIALARPDFYPIFAQTAYPFYPYAELAVIFVSTDFRPA